MTAISNFDIFARERHKEAPFSGEPRVSELLLRAAGLKASGQIGAALGIIARRAAAGIFLSVALGCALVCGGWARDQQAKADNT